MTRHYVIVGMGAAGVAAAEAIRAADAAGEIALVSDDPHGYYSRPGLAYYLTGEVPEKALFPFSRDDLARLNVRHVQGRAVKLRPTAHRLDLAGGTHLAFDRLLLATGSLAVPVRVPGAELAGVVKLDDMADARQILQRARRGQTAVAVGGGITALELAEGLRARHVRTHYFVRRERYWSNVLDEAESYSVESRLRADGVEIHYHTELAAIEGTSGRVSGVRTESGETIPCDLVAVAIGVRPRLELAAGSGLKLDRGILVNEFLESSVPSVFAAGDVAQVLDPATGWSGLNTLWNVAVDEGRAAGRNMAGQTAAYCHSMPLNITRLAGLTTTIIGTVGQGREGEAPGLSRGDSETWRQQPGAIAVRFNSGDNHVRLMVGERTLSGAVVMGDQALSRPLQQLIGSQADISPIRDRLIEAGARLAEIVDGFWAEWREGHASS